MISPAKGWSIDTGLNSVDGAWSSGTFGTVNDFPAFASSDDAVANVQYLGESREIARLGQSRLIEYRGYADVDGTVGSRFAVRTPFGSEILLDRALWNTWYGDGRVAWADGEDTWGPLDPELEQSARVLQAGAYCFSPHEVLIESFDASEWTTAGVHTQGVDVYLPVEGGNDLAKATWKWMKDNSFGWTDENPYPYKKYEDFLEDRSVFAWERPDGQWVLGLNSNAVQSVYECA